MRLPPELRCPAHGTPLVGALEDDGQAAAGLRCTRGCAFPVRGGIPRFAGSAADADDSEQHSSSQRAAELDSHAGTTLARDRLARCLGGSLDVVGGRSVLEVGCGAGRFTELLLAAGARVFACDASAAVEANHENCGRESGYFVCQADVLALPAKPHAFEVVVALGIIQHTANPERTIEALASRVAPGGLLVLDHLAPVEGPAPVVASGRPADRHEHVRKPRQIASALRAAGLEVVDCRREGAAVEARARRPAVAVRAHSGRAAAGGPHTARAAGGAAIVGSPAAAGSRAVAGSPSFPGSASAAAGSASAVGNAAGTDTGPTTDGKPAAGDALSVASPTAAGSTPAAGAARSGPEPGGTPRVRIVVVARLEDHKLASKLLPLASLPEVEELALVRRTPLALEGVRSLCPPRLLARRTLLAEPWRLATLLRLVSRWPRERTFVVSFFLKPHALYAEIARRLFGVRTIPVALSQEDVQLAVSRRLWRRVLRAAHAAGVRGARSRERLVAAGIDAARVFEPPNLHDPSRYPPADPAKADLDVLYVGALVPVKQVDLLLRALALVKLRRKNLRAAVVGGGPLRDTVDDLRRELGLRQNLHVVGPRPFEEVPDWLRRARLFVMTSRMEGLPMAMVEALSCGVPVVVPDVGDVTTVAQDGVNAWVVRESSPEAYAEAILTLLEDEPRRARLAAGALALRERFAAEYSLEAAQRAWRRALLGPGPE